MACRKCVRVVVGGVATDAMFGAFSAGQLVQYDGTQFVGVSPAGGGSGDFVGPASSAAGNIVAFADTSGKLGADSGVSASSHASRHGPGGGDTIFAGSWAAAEVPAWNGSSWSPKFERVLEASSEFTGAGTSLTDITGLTVALPRAGTYWFDFELVTSQSASAAIAFGINVTANFTRCAVSVFNPTTATATAQGGQVANNTATASGTRSVTTNLPVSLIGTVTIGGAATLGCRAQRASGTLTIRAGSGGLVREL